MGVRSLHVGFFFRLLPFSQSHGPFQEVTVELIAPKEESPEVEEDPAPSPLTCQDILLGFMI